MQSHPDYATITSLPGLADLLQGNNDPWCAAHSTTYTTLAPYAIGVIKRQVREVNSRPHANRRGLACVGSARRQVAMS